MYPLDPTSNFAIAPLASGYASGDTVLQVGPGTGVLFPDPDTAGDFNAVYWNATDYGNPADDPYVEIVRVTDNTADVFTVVRAQEGTSATDKNIDGKTYQIMLAITAKMIADIQANLNAIGSNVAANQIARGDGDGGFIGDNGLTFDGHTLVVNNYIGDSMAQAQVLVQYEGTGALELINWGPGDSEIHFDVQIIDGQYIATNDFAAMIIETSDQLQFYTGGGNTVGDPLAVANLAMWLDGVGNMSLLAMMQDQSEENSWDFNNRIGYDVAGREVFKYENLGGHIQVGDIGANENGCLYDIDDSTYTHTIYAVPSAQVSSVDFDGSGTNDINIEGSFNATAPVTFVATVDSVNNYHIQLNTPAPSPNFQVGETVIVTVGPGAGTTATVASVSDINVYVMNANIIGSGFGGGGTLVGETSNASQTIRSAPRIPDTFSWAASDSSGSGSLIPMSNKSGIPNDLSDGVAVYWTGNTNHTLGDDWTWTYTNVAARIAVFNGYYTDQGTGVLVKIGDVDNVEGGPLVTIDGAAEQITLYASEGIIIQNLAGNGDGFATIDNDGLIGFLADSGSPGLSTVITTDSAMNGTVIQVTSNGDDIFENYYDNIILGTDVYGNIVLTFWDEDGISIVSQLIAESFGQISIIDASSNTWFLVGTAEGTSQFGYTTNITLLEESGAMELYSDSIVLEFLNGAGGGFLTVDDTGLVGISMASSSSPTIVASANLSGLTSGDSSVFVFQNTSGYTRSYEIASYLNVSTLVGTLSPIISWYDENNDPQNMTIIPTGQTVGSVTGPGYYILPSITIRVYPGTYIYIGTGYGGSAVDYDMGVTAMDLQN